MKSLFFNTIVILLLSLPYHARAADSLTPVNFKGIYEFRFAGLPLGRMGGEVEQAADHYSIATDVTLVGVVKMFVQHTSHTAAEGSGHDFTYPDIVYEARYQTRKKKHYVKLVYKNGGLHHEQQIPPDPPGKRPPVPAAMLKDSADPISIIIRARQALWEALHTGAKAFSINLYDGNRLTQIDFTIVGNDDVRYGNKMISTIKVALHRKQLAGFTKSELKEYDPREPTAYLYFSKDELIPVRAETRFLFSAVTAVLVKRCLPSESCLLGIKD